MMNNCLTSAGMPSQSGVAKSGKNRGAFAGASIDPKDNGYNLNAHYDAADPKKGYPEGDHTVHNDRGALLDHLEGLLAKHEKSVKGKR